MSSGCGALLLLNDGRGAAAARDSAWRRAASVALCHRAIEKRGVDEFAWWRAARTPAKRPFAYAVEAEEGQLAEMREAGFGLWTFGGGWIKRRRLTGSKQTPSALGVHSAKGFSVPGHAAAASRSASHAEAASAEIRAVRPTL
jgi:hypothetical protein